MLTNLGETAPPAMATLDGLLAQIDRESLHDQVELLPSPRSREKVAGAVKHLVFALAGMHYALPLDNVLEIQRLPRMTVLPNVPDWLLGVTNVRGEITSVVDLRTLLGMPPLEDVTDQRWVVIRSTREDVSLGLVVDRVAGIRGIVADEVKPCSSMLSGVMADFVRGLVARDKLTIAVLDANRILASSELRQFDAAWNDESPA